MFSDRILEARRLRDLILDKIRIDEAPLGELLNFPNNPSLIIFNDSDVTDEFLKRLRALAGPNGLTIYKIMLIRANVSVHDS